MPLAFAESTTAHMTIENSFIVLDNEINLKENETLDLTNYVISTHGITVTIEDVSETFPKQVKILAQTENVDITMFNSDLNYVTIIIPDVITLLAPDSWDHKFLPPTEISVMGNIPSGYQSTDSVIQIGSLDTIILFDKPVTIILDNVNGDMGHRLAGENSWYLLDTCSGSYESPGPPVFPNECTISNGVHTKIVTYHFTHFAEFEKIEEEEEEIVEEEIVEEEIVEEEIVEEENNSRGSSGGGRKSTNISPENPGFSGTLKTSSINDWVKQPVKWWLNGDITDKEFSIIIGWLIDEDVIKIENKTKPSSLLTSITPFAKSMFSMWEQDRLADSYILNFIEKSRGLGFW
jgi:hypothetical protein